jgi:hypothetical protein
VLSAFGALVNPLPDAAKTGVQTAAEAPASSSCDAEPFVVGRS